MRPFSTTIATAEKLRITEQERHTWLQLAIRLYDLWSYIDKHSPPKHWNRGCWIIEWGVLTKALVRVDPNEPWHVTHNQLGKRFGSRFADKINEFIFGQVANPSSAAKRIFFFLCGNEKLLPQSTYDEMPMVFPPEFKAWMTPFFKYELPSVRAELGQPSRDGIPFGEDLRPAFLETVYPELAPITFE